MADISALIVKEMPENLKVGADTIGPIKWYDEDLDIEEDEFPKATFKRIGRRHLAQGLQGGVYAQNTTSHSDVIAFVSGTNDYQVSERDIVAITSVTGTRLGGAYTFVQGTDYERVKTDAYDTYNAVRWKDGGNKPDNGTNFTINYTRRVLDKKGLDYVKHTFRVTLKVKDLAATEKGATAAITATRLIEQMMQALEDHLSLNRGKALDALNGISLAEHMSFGPVGANPGEGFLKGVMELTIHERRLYTGAQVKTIGKVESPTSSFTTL